jgi:hypothetical protein
MVDVALYIHHTTHIRQDLQRVQLQQRVTL